MNRRLLKITLGVLVGAGLGYTYYALIGCSSGGCAITSSPVNSTAYGAVVGLVATAW